MEPRRENWLQMTREGGLVKDVSRDASTMGITDSAANNSSNGLYLALFRIVLEVVGGGICRSDAE